MLIKYYKLLLICICAVTFMGSTIIFAGDIDTMDAPEFTMYTLTDIYNLIHDNNTTPAVHTLSPSSTPNATSSYSVSQLYADLTNLVDKGNLETGITYLGITGDYGNPGTNSVEVIPSSLTPSGTAGDPTGYSLEDIWNLITDVGTTTAGAHADTPATTPASSMHSLTDIYNELITLGTTKASSVAVGSTYLGAEGSYFPLVIPTDGLISYWSFDGDATDSFGSNDGIVTGAVLTAGVKGETDTAYSFNGINNDITINDFNTDYDEVTVSAWVRPVSWNIIGARQNPILDTWGNVSGSTPYRLTFSNPPGTNGILSWFYETGVSGYVGASYTSLSLNDWYYVTGTREYSDGVYAMNLYVNGVLVDSTSSTGVPFKKNLQEITIGSRTYDPTDGTERFDGIIDNVRIYSRALSEEEINIIYNNEKPE